MAAPVDWADPCARFVALRAAYMDAIRGARSSVRFQSGDTSQSVDYSPANVSLLRTEMMTAQRECQLLTGMAPRQRFAIQVGARRQPLANRTGGPGIALISEPDGE